MAKTDAMWRKIFNEAREAGITAGKAAVPTPMVLVEDTGALFWVSRPGKTYVVDEGPFGWAWVKVHPGTSSFARWLVKAGRGEKSYNGGGIEIWISDHDSSVVRKEAHAEALAAVLREHEIRAYAGSRLD